MTPAENRRLLILVVALIIAVSSFALGSVLGFSLQPSPQSSGITHAGNPNDHGKNIAACIDRTLDKIKAIKITAGFYERAWRLCSNELFNGLYLEDFLIRREKFLRQYLDERVTLWLVVSITISGILLAAVQLFMSFRLASKGIGDFAKDSELAFENAKLSIKSSITGAVILALSLAFFMVYVIWIYTVHEVPIEKPATLQTPSEWINRSPNEGSQINPLPPGQQAAPSQAQEPK